jgi:hypothetical protein
MAARNECTLGLLAVVLLMLGLSHAGVAQLVLYDNFNSKNIDPMKWTGFQFFSPDQREAVRELVADPEGSGGHQAGGGRRLHIAERDYATTTDDFGGNGDTFGLEFSNPAAITETSFTLTVNSAKAVACLSNPIPFATGAEFRGHFFNTETSPPDQIGDIQAVIAVSRFPTDVGSALTVAGWVERCADQFWGSTTTLDYHVLGHVMPGVPSTLRIKWDKPNHQFVFQLNHQPEVTSPYTVSDTTPAVFPFKILDLARVVPHCTTTPSAYIAIDALFGNVYVNP